MGLSCTSDRFVKKLVRLLLKLKNGERVRSDLTSARSGGIFHHILSRDDIPTLVAFDTEGGEHS